MRITITGGAGFIGHHLANKLRQKGHEVTVLDNFSHSCGALQTAIYSDVRYYQDIAPRIKNSDLVFHLAAEINVDKSIANPEETYDVNVKGTLNVLEACRQFKKPLIFASSSEVYGSAQTDKISESHPLDAQSPYAASKVAGERLCYAYWKTYGLPVKIIRNFNTFGPWQHSGDFIKPRGGASYGSVIAIFTARVLRGLPPIIFGDGRQERDYMYIDDCVNAYELMMEKGEFGKPVNFGSGEAVSVNQIAKEVLEACDSKLEPVHTTERAGEVQRLCADIKTATGLGFEPNLTFTEGIRAYVEWFKENYAEMLENEKKLLNRDV